MSGSLPSGIQTQLGADFDWNASGNDIPMNSGWAWGNPGQNAPAAMPAPSAAPAPAPALSAPTPQAPAQPRSAVPTTPRPPNVAAPSPAAPAQPPMSQAEANELDPNAEPVFVGPAAATDPSTAKAGGGLFGAAKNFWKEMEGSGLQVGADLASGGANVSRFVARSPVMTKWFETQRAALANHVAKIYSTLPQEDQDAMNYSVFGGNKPGMKAPGWGAYLGATIASAIPDAAMLVGAGVLTGIGATAAGVSAPLAGIVALAAPALLGGTQQLGAAWQSLTDGLQKTPDNVLRKSSPKYAADRAKGFTEVQAKQRLAGTMEPWMAAQFGLGAITSAGATDVALHGVADAAGKGLLKRVELGAAKGSLATAVQGGGGDVLGQAAAMSAGTQKQFDPTETARAVASGAPLGALMGAAGGVFHGGRAGAKPAAPRTADIAAPEALDTSDIPDLTGGEEPSETQDESKATTVAGPDVGAAATEALKPDEKTPAPATNTPAAPVPTMTVTPDNVTTQGFAPPDAKTPAAVSPTVPEPQSDIDAQFAAIRDKSSTKDSMFIPEGGAVPRGDKTGLTIVRRDGWGTFITSDKAKAQSFRRAKSGNDTVLARLLGYTETKDQAVASGNPAVVQAHDAQGNVVHEQAVSQAGIPAAVEAADKAAPAGGGTLVTSPDHALARRNAITGGEPTAMMPLTPKTVAPGEEAPAVTENPSQAPEPPAQEPQSPPAEPEPPSIAAPASEEPQANQVSPSQPARELRKQQMRPPGARQRGEMVSFGEYREPIAEEPASRAEAPSEPTEDEEAIHEETSQTVEEPEAAAEPEPEATTVGAEGEPNEEAPKIAQPETPLPKRRAPSTTNTDRLASDLMKRVLNGELTPSEAEAQYQAKSSHTGRPRKHPTLASFIRDEIAQASDPDLEKKILAQATAGKTTLKSKRVAQTRALNALIARTDPDRIQALKDAADELDTPSKLPGKKEPESRHDPANGAVLAHLFTSPDRDVKSFLRLVATRPAIRKTYPHLSTLARFLGRVLPDGIKVLSQREALHKYGDEAGGDRGYYGYYIHGRSGKMPAHIVLNEHTPEALVQTVVHEALHAATTTAIDRLFKPTRNKAEMWKPIDPRNPQARALWAIAREFTDAANQHIALRNEMGTDAGTLGNLVERADYTIRDPRELVSMMLTNPEAQEIAAAHTPSPEFRATMQRLGFGTPKHGIWGSFLRLVGRFIGIHPLDTAESLLDHATRMMPDLMTGERAPAAQRALETAHALRAPKITKQEVAERAARAADLGRRHDIVRRMALVGLTRDGMINIYKDLFRSRDPEDLRNSLIDWRAAAEKIEAASKQYRDATSDRLSALLGRVRALPNAQQDELARLRNDATIAEAHLMTRDPKANAHLTEPEQKATLADLQRRYAALTPEQRSLYHDLTAFDSQEYAHENEAKMQGILSTAFPAATDAQRKALRTALSTRAGITDLLADDKGASAVAQAFGKDWQANRPLINEIARTMRSRFVRGDYAPLRRRGNYVLRYGTKGTDNYGVEMFENKHEARARRRELLAAGQENVSRVLDRSRSDLHELLPPTVVARLDHMLAARPDLEGHRAAIRNLIQQMQLQHATRSQIARLAPRRQGIRGASIDMARNLAEDYLARANRMGHLLHGGELADALERMRQRVVELGRDPSAKDEDQIKAAAILHEAEARMPSSNDSAGAFSNLMRQANMFGFAQSLISVSRLLTTSIEAHQNSLAFLGAHGSYGRATLALGKAMRDLAPTMLSRGIASTAKVVHGELAASDWNLSTLAMNRLVAKGADPAEMRALFKEINGAGLLDQTVERDVQRTANGAHRALRSWYHRFIDFNMIGAHAVDVMNKAAITKAAYDLERQKGGTPEQARAYAMEIARNAMPNWARGNRARISTRQGPLGSLGAPIMQFKNYGLHMYSVMASLAHESMHGATRAERIEARKALAGIIIAHVAMAGALNTISDPLRFLGGAYDWITAGRPEDHAADFRRLAAEFLPKRVAQLATMGLPEALGIDVHNRVGLGNLLEFPDMEGFKTADWLKAFGEVGMGAAGQDVVQMLNGMQSLARGDDTYALEQIMPRMIRDPIHAAEMATRGITNMKGQTEVPASKLSTRDIVVQALGFVPADVSEFRQGRAAVRDMRGRVDDERHRLLNQAVQATPSQRREVWQQISAFNRANPGARITVGNVLASKRANEKPLGPFGLRVPRRMIPAAQQAGSFAVTP